METWQGNPPENCQLCQTKIDNAFVDGKVVVGGHSGWVIMCPICALTNGVGLGLGKGQLYIKTATLDGKFVRAKG
jgi:hypothetical protein